MDAVAIDRELGRRQFRDGLRWVVDNVAVAQDELVVSGWTVPKAEAMQGEEILLNGEAFRTAEFGLPSEDLAGLFPELPEMARARFRCTQPNGPGLWRNGCVRFDYFRPGDGLAAFDASAWYTWDPANEPPVPEARHFLRNIAGTAANYKRGGSTIARRLADCVLALTGRPLGELAVLDWGCGCGRVGRYLRPSGGGWLDGADIDPLNLLWTRANLANYRRVHHLDGLPPTAIADASYDVIFGLSVFTHLREEAQRAWLEELRRILRPDGLALMSVHGPAELYLTRVAADFYGRVEGEGFVVTGVNPTIPGYVAGDDYYVDVYHSPGYIRSVWGRHFRIVDIMPAVGLFQDVVVMRPLGG